MNLYNVFKNCNIEDLKKHLEETKVDIKNAENQSDRKFHRKEYEIIKKLINEKNKK